MYRALEIGESFVGDDFNAAHLNTVLGPRTGPVGAAWATALASPTKGHIPFMCVLQPGYPVKPVTLFINKAACEEDRHSFLTWGPAQAGVAGGVMDAVADGIIPAAEVEDLALIAAVWVSPHANDPDAIYHNNRAATRQALEAGKRGTPTIADLLAIRDRPQNPYYTPPA